MTEAYPLSWPAGKERTRAPRRSQFGNRHTIASTSREVHKELRLLGASGVVVSCNLLRNIDGSIRSAQRQPDDKGVAVYFTLKGRQQCIALDRWDRIEHNLHAITKSIESLRGLDRWGGGEMVDAAFRGFQALPSPDMVLSMPQRKAWHAVLMVDSEATDDVRRAAYRTLARTAHPDTGGTREAWDELQQAAREAGLVDREVGHVDVRSTR